MKGRVSDMGRMEDIFPSEHQFEGVESTVENMTDAFHLYWASAVEVNNANKIQEEHLAILIKEHPKLAKELGFVTESYLEQIKASIPFRDAIAEEIKLRTKTIEFASREKKIRE